MGIRLFIVVFVMTLFTASLASADPVVSYPIQYGWVNNAQLSDLAPGQRNPYDLLLYRHLKEAIPAMRQEAAMHPNSLAAYLGLIQSDPSIWTQEIEHLRTQIQAMPDADNQFKLGALLFYKWGQQPPPPRNKKLLAEAQILLGQAWRHEHKPVIGLMLGEALSVGYASTDAALKGLSTQTINEQLLQELCGPDVYNQYRYAKEHHWQTSPPRVTLVPKSSRKALLAVVASTRSSVSHRVGSVRIVNGHSSATYAPDSLEYKSQQHYWADWFTSLVAETK